MKLSVERRKKMAERDLAHEISKHTKNIEDIRYYKNIRNQVNCLISKEKYKREKSTFL